MKLTIDKAGRIVIPKPLREALRLEPGDALDLERDGDTLQLRPVRPRVPLRRENGLYYGEGAVDANAVLEEVREERIRSFIR